MKKIFISCLVLVFCIGTIMSVSAEGQASGDVNSPTLISLNESFDSELSTTHEVDYYTFVLDAQKQVLIECLDILPDREYTMTLSGSNIENISTSDSTNGNGLYITSVLEAGTYNISVQGEFPLESTSSSDTYKIIVNDNVAKGGYVLNSNDKVVIDNDFEDEDTSKWLEGFRPHAVRGIKTIENDENGKYVAFTAVDSSQYYVFDAEIYSSKVLCSEFDIKFPSGEMQLQIKKATSNLDGSPLYAGRIRKFSKYLQYYIIPEGSTKGQWMYLTDESNNWIRLDESKWYTVRITLDVRTRRWSIYLEDRDSGEVISEVKSLPFIDECDVLNYYAFSSYEKMCIDNIRLFESEVGVNIDGWTYIKVPQSGIQQYKYFNTLSKSEKAWSADQWTLLNTVNGISIDNSTGILSVSSDAKPSSVIVCASRKYFPWIKSAFLVDIDR